MMSSGACAGALSGAGEQLGSAMHVMRTGALPA